MGIYLAPRLKRFYLEQKLTTKDKQALTSHLLFESSKVIYIAA